MDTVGYTDRQTDTHMPESLVEMIMAVNTYYSSTREAETRKQLQILG